MSSSIAHLPYDEGVALPALATSFPWRGVQRFAVALVAALWAWKIVELAGRESGLLRRTAWELRNGVAVAIDPMHVGLVRFGRSQLAGMNEADFITAVRDAAQSQETRK